MFVLPSGAVTMLVGGDVDSVDTFENLRPVKGTRAAEWGASVRHPLDSVVAQIETRPRPRRARFAKRTLDVVGRVLGLIVIAPLLLLISVAVKLTSRGPVVFVQERCGLGGRRFRFYKFRTMVQDPRPASASSGT